MYASRKTLTYVKVANYLFLSAAILIVAIAMGSTSVAAQQSNCASTRGSCSDHCGVANTNAHASEPA